MLYLNIAYSASFTWSVHKPAISHLSRNHRLPLPAPAWTE
jgi:hypothetical protein